VTSSRTSSEVGAGSSAPGAAGQPVDVTMPQMGVSVAEGTVVAWRVDVGERIEADATICEISTDKIDTDVPSPVSGVVAEILVPAESTVDVGTVLARIAVAGDSGDGPTPPAAGMPESAGEPARASAGGPASGATAEVGRPSMRGRDSDSANGAGRRYSPVVQRIAAEHGVDLEQVAGTGRGGRVRKQDVLAFIESAAAEEAPLHIESPYQPEPEAAGSQLSRMRRQIGEHMKRSLETAAHCTTWIEVDMGRVEAARARLGVTALAFVARASIDAIREHPALNAWLEGERYTRPTDVNLGIAVSLGEDGLIVPVIHKAHELSVEGLAVRIKDLARRARERELTPDDVRLGTFTITNPGQYGSIMATPIINLPQVAILDLEAVVKRPVVVSDAEGNDSIAIRPMTILGLSWDHRALDGGEAAQFLATVKRHLETA
jgi:pyruvate/2-oxoglutarate dehydrogenase complex dihydrolipoamide acyltransferase (E2) component